MVSQKTLVSAILLCFSVQTIYCFQPVRVGHLASIHSDYSVSGLVYLLDRSTIYVKDFVFNWDNTVPGLRLQLKGTSYHNNSVIPITDVGEGVVNALECLTDSPTCCRGRDNPNGGGQGEWHYPDGSTVPRPVDAAGSVFYRTRDDGEIRLNRRAPGETPTGKYCCKLPNSQGDMETICVDLVSDSSASQEDAHFCVGYSPDANTTVAMPLGQSSVGFNSPYSSSHLHLRLPNTCGINHLEWVGVCTSSGVLARITLHPSVILQLPCEAKFLGDLPSTGNEGISGRLYLVNRVTFALLSFNYLDANENDAVFMTSVGSPSVNGYQLSSYNDHAFASLKAIVDQDSLVGIPSEAEGVELTYFSVWSRSRNQALSTLMFPNDTIPSLPDTIPGANLGDFVMRLHQIAGTGYAMNETKLYIRRFNYDGTAPATTFRVIRGTHYLLAEEHADLLDEEGNIGNLRAYNYEDIVLTLPEGYTVHNTDQLIIWCEHFRTSFGELTFPDTVSFESSNMEQIQPPPPPPREVCPPLELEETRNCKRLHNDLTMSWVLDEQHDRVTIELCGCNVRQDDLYVAFGLSGSNSRIQMINSDPVWAWLDNSGVHAQELVINQYSQCNYRTGSNRVVTETGVCPEAASNITAVSAHVEGCMTCFRFNRPIRASDGNDKSITPGRKQWVVWAIGPVGSLVTPTGSVIPIPFKHYRRADYTDNLEVDFGRAPLDECGTAVCGCNIQAALTPWRQETLEHTTTVSVRIGQSGGQRGYAGITGIVGWGISIYLNGTLIPKFKVYRGVEYTFIVETGNKPGSPARYHPFYITSSQRGGYSTLSAEDQKAETIYAGLGSNGNWLGVGRFCFYGPEGPDRADDFSSFGEYNETLTLQCDEGSPGTFTWTPNDDTPDVVYYQCASHQYLGWEINVMDPPPELLPITVDFSLFSPMVVGNSVQVFFSTTKRAESVACQLLNKDTNKLSDVTCKNDFGNTYIYNKTKLSPASYEIQITVNKGLEDATVFRREFDVLSDPLSCAVFLRDTEPIKFDKVERELTILFDASGLHDNSFTCTTNDKPTACPRRKYSSSDLRSGWNKVCIRSAGCEGGSQKNMAVYYNTITGDVVEVRTSNCSAHSINISTSIAQSVTPTPSVHPTSPHPHTSTAGMRSTHKTNSGTTSERIIQVPVSQTTQKTSIGSTSGRVVQVTPTSEVKSQTSTVLGQVTSQVGMRTTVLSSSEVASSSRVLNELVSSTVSAGMSTSLSPLPTGVLPGGVRNNSAQILSSNISLVLSTIITILMTVIATQ